MSDVWSPIAYLKIIEVDEEMLADAIEDCFEHVARDTDARHSVGEALRYAGKVQDNLKLLHQSLNRACTDKKCGEWLPHLEHNEANRSRT